MFNWLKNSIFIRPAALYAPFKCRVFNVYELSPLREIHGSVSNRYPMVTPVIVILLISCRPYYVARFITSVVVNTFNRMVFGWSWSNMVKECHKIIFPFITDCYASATIVLKPCIFRVKTAVEHRAPCAVFDRVRHAVRNNKVFFETTATLGMPGSQAISNDDSCDSTDTLALPLYLLPFSVLRLANDGKSSKSLAGKINEFHNKTSLVKGCGCGEMLAGGQPGSRFSGMTLASS